MSRIRWICNAAAPGARIEIRVAWKGIVETTSRHERDNGENAALVSFSPTHGEIWTLRGPRVALDAVLLIVGALNAEHREPAPRDDELPSLDPW